MVSVGGSVSQPVTDDEHDTERDVRSGESREDATGEREPPSGERVARPRMIGQHVRGCGTREDGRLHEDARPERCSGGDEHEADDGTKNERLHGIPFRG